MESNEEDYLLTPLEAKTQQKGSSGGSFFIPIYNKKPFSFYQVDFSIYKGKGTFESDNRFKLILFQTITLNHFSLMMPSFITSPSQECGCIKCEACLVIRDSSPLLRYKGRELDLQDYYYPFIEIEPVDPTFFDNLLDRFKISIIGTRDPNGRPV